MIQIKRTLNFTSLLTEMSFDIDANGIIIDYVLVLPNFTTAATANLSIQNADGYVHYLSTDNFAENGTRLKNAVEIPVDYGHKGKLVLNAAAGGSHTAIVYLYIKEE